MIYVLFMTYKHEVFHQQMLKLFKITQNTPKISLLTLSLTQNLRIKSECNSIKGAEGDSNRGGFTVFRKSS